MCIDTIVEEIKSKIEYITKTSELKYNQYIDTIRQINSIIYDYQGVTMAKYQSIMEMLPSAENLSEMKKKKQETETILDLFGELSNKILFDIHNKRFASDISNLSAFHESEVSKISSNFIALKTGIGSYIKVNLFFSGLADSNGLLPISISADEAKQIAIDMTNSEQATAVQEVAEKVNRQVVEEQAIEEQNSSTQKNLEQRTLHTSKYNQNFLEECTFENNISYFFDQSTQADIDKCTSQFEHLSTQTDEQVEKQTKNKFIQTSEIKQKEKYTQTDPTHGITKTKSKYKKAQYQAPEEKDKKAQAQANEEDVLLDIQKSFTEFKRKFDEITGSKSKKNMAGKLAGLSIHLQTLESKIKPKTK
ncbi:hypothetical protein AB837_00565 [bacterium AB1]|nr:hypothetical protein AB837_00565 [bacterium AB1]